MHLSQYVSRMRSEQPAFPLSVRGGLQGYGAELDFLRENRQWLAQAIKVYISTDEMNCLAVLLRQAGKKREKPPEELYAYFLQALDRALNETAQSLPPQAAPEDLPRLALDLALRSYASQLACARILDILQPPCEEAPKKAKK